MKLNYLTNRHWVPTIVRQNSIFQPILTPDVLEDLNELFYIDEASTRLQSPGFVIPFLTFAHWCKHPTLYFSKWIPIVRYCMFVVIYLSLRNPIEIKTDKNPCPCFFHWEKHTTLACERQCVQRGGQRGSDRAMVWEGIGRKRLAETMTFQLGPNETEGMVKTWLWKEHSGQRKEETQRLYVDICL